ncbi:hypothetical protein Ddc_00027 [Ditylenchus destructor]|nr:hypothetical protein Ddc_00027 [Ditylenchus destructor]
MCFPKEIQLEALKFLPYENAKNLLMVQKYWMLPLRIQIIEQRIAMLSEIVRLNESHQALEKLRFQYMQQYLVTRHQIERAGSDFALQITVRERNVQPGQWPLQNVQLLNDHLQSLQTLQPDFDTASLELLRIKMKIEALVDKRNRLHAILGHEAEKTVNDRIAELEEQKNHRRGRIDGLATINSIHRIAIYLQRLTVLGVGIAAPRTISRCRMEANLYWLVQGHPMRSDSGRLL